MSSGYGQQNSSRRPQKTQQQTISNNTKQPPAANSARAMTGPPKHTNNQDNERRVKTNNSNIHHNSATDNDSYPGQVEEAITFDYLLQKVVENTAAMTNKTTQDGCTENTDDLHHLDEPASYRVQIEDEKVAVHEVTQQQ